MGKTSGNNREYGQEKTWKVDRTISVRKIGKKVSYAYKIFKY